MEVAQKYKFPIRDAVKNYFFSVKGGGYPPFPLSFFGHNDTPVWGGGVPPNSVKEKIRWKTAIFGQKTPILALFDPFF